MCENLIYRVHVISSVQVCDEPHPLLVKNMLEHCVSANIDEAYKVMTTRVSVNINQ